MKEGYILFNENGDRLTRNLRWSSQENAGWLWTEGEATVIIANGINATHYQRCELVEEDGDVNVYALEDIQEI